MAVNDEEIGSKETDDSYSITSSQLPASSQESFSSKTQSKFSCFIDSFKRAEPQENDLENGQSIKITSLEDSLKDRHVKMIAIGGCIGSGLFISSGSALASSGPAGLVISYVIIGVLMYFVVQSLGELTSSFPVQGNFLVYNTRFIDESWGFAMNWNYCLLWIVTIPLSLVSASLTIGYWKSDINSAVWVAIFYVIICLINIFGVKGYGEGEFVFSLIKIAAIIGFCILAIVLISGGGAQGYIGAKYWHHPGAFNNGFHGVCSVFVNAAFSFSGTELCALAAAESKNPRKALKKAIKQVFWRIIIFYLLSITLVCFLVPYNDPELLSNSSSSSSPFVIAIKNGGIRYLPSIFNVVILLAVLSVANASVFASYKPLVALAEAGHGPKFLAYVDRKGRPTYAILVTLSFGLIGFVCASSKQAEVFNWLLALSGLSTIFIWFSISLAQVRVNYAYKAQGISRDELPFKAFGGDYGAYFSMLVNVLILIAQFYVGLYPVTGPSLDASTFFQLYLAAPIVIVFYVGHKIWTKNWNLYIKAEDIDLTTGRHIIDIDLIKQEQYEEEVSRKAKPWYYRFAKIWC